MFVIAESNLPVLQLSPLLVGVVGDVPGVALRTEIDAAASLSAPSVVESYDDLLCLSLRAVHCLA